MLTEEIQLSKHISPLYRVGDREHYNRDKKEKVIQERHCCTLKGRVSCKQSTMQNLTRGCYRVGRPCLYTLGGGRGAAC